MCLVSRLSQQKQQLDCALGNFIQCICGLCRPQNVCQKRDSPDDIHYAMGNENTVSPYFTGKQILPFGLQSCTVAGVPAFEDPMCRCLSCVTALLVEQDNIQT